MIVVKTTHCLDTNENFACKFIHYNQYMARLSRNLLYVCQTKTLDTNGVSWFCISTISFAYFLMHMTGLAVATIKIPLLQRPCIHWVVYTSMKKLYRSHESSLTLTEIKYCCSNYQKNMSSSKSITAAAAFSFLLHNRLLSQCAH